LHDILCFFLEADAYDDVSIDGGHKAYIKNTEGLSVSALGSHNNSAKVLFRRSFHVWHII
jgi:hypothetical protein